MTTTLFQIDWSELPARPDDVQATGTLQLTLGGSVFPCRRWKLSTLPFRLGARAA